MTEEQTGPVTPDEAADTPPASPSDEALSEVETLRAELEEARQQQLRALADYQNLQRRQAEERQEFARYQLASVVLNFLPVLDDLQRALEAAESEAGAAWVEGVRLVEQKFRGVLEASGVQEIEAEGVRFDPAVHEALGAAPGPEGEVVHCLQPGYRLQDRVIRAARVMVGNGEQAGTASTDEHTTSESPGN